MAMQPTSLRSSSPSRSPSSSTTQKIETPEAALTLLNSLRADYADVRESYNLLVYGLPGTFKTPLIATARAPILLYQFDPGGVSSIKEHVESGRVIVVDFTGEDPADPQSFRRWEKMFMQHSRAGLFNHIGTVALDSITTWASSMMLKILKANNKPFVAGAVDFNRQKGNNTAPSPGMPEYGSQLMAVSNYVKLLTELPCDTIITAHAKDVYNEETERVEYIPMLAGQQQTAVALMFNEIYVSTVKRVTEKVDGKDVTRNKFMLRTRPGGGYQVARSRLGREGNRLDEFVEPNIQEILKKFDREWEDLPFNL